MLWLITAAMFAAAFAEAPALYPAPMLQQISVVVMTHCSVTTLCHATIIILL
jgi:hypothetical protein